MMLHNQAYALLSFEILPTSSRISKIILKLNIMLQLNTYLLCFLAGFGAFATSIMSHEQYLNQFSFQTIANVNFTDDASIVHALKDLKESGALTVLLLMQQENAYKLMRMVKINTFSLFRVFITHLKLYAFKNMYCMLATNSRLSDNFLARYRFHWLEKFIVFNSLSRNMRCP